MGSLCVIVWWLVVRFGLDVDVVFDFVCVGLVIGLWVGVGCHLLCVR